MDVPDTEYWCMYGAALWIVTRSFDVRDAVLDRPARNALIKEWQCRREHALTWLEENKRAMLPKYRYWYPEKVLDLAFDELASDIWFELACENVREERGVPFKSRSELRAAIGYKRMYVDAQKLVANFPVPRRGRPKNTSASADAWLVAAVEDLCRTGLSQREACEALHREGHKVHSPEAALKKLQRAKRKR